MVVPKYPKDNQNFHQWYESVKLKSFMNPCKSEFTEVREMRRVQPYLCPRRRKEKNMMIT